MTGSARYRSHKHSYRWFYLGLAILLLLLVVANLLVGDVAYTPSEIARALRGVDDGNMLPTILRLRLNRMVVALMIGIVLPLCGLMMQTIFQNPLADPYILGVSSGTSLGVALFVLGVPLMGGVGASVHLIDIGMIGAGWIGALVVLALVLGLSRRVSNIFGILIIGVMISYITSAVIQILQYFSSAEQLKLYTLWSLGSLSGVTQAQLGLMVPILLVGILLAILCMKPLNLLLLGEEQATSMGLNVKRTRTLVFGATTLMAGTATVLCGPIGFVGLATPHVARALFRTADHRVLLPATALIGACLMMFADLLAKLFTIPINAVTALMGIPIILIVVFRTLK
ncbi:MAG: iron ABC transporter permease [Porphyromonas sp.]|nr:iron ABC transporter permease [Porphyromonas sp.]